MARVTQIITPHGRWIEEDMQKISARYNVPKRIIEYMDSPTVMSKLQRADDRYMEVPWDGSEIPWIRQIRMLKALSYYKAVIIYDNDDIIAVNNYGLGDKTEQIWPIADEVSNEEKTNNHNKGGCLSITIIGFTLLFTIVGLVKYGEIYAT